MTVRGRVRGDAEARVRPREAQRAVSQGRTAGRSQQRGEAGFTLVEMGVSLLILSIFMAMIVSGMVHLVGPALQTGAIRDSSDQLDIAFLDLDSEVRYASAVWAPYAGNANDDWDIEFESTFSGAAEPTCTELKYNYATGQLLQASWSVGSNVAPGFKVLATDLTGSADPFDAPVQSASSPYQKVQLMVTLSATSGSGPNMKTTKSSVTFTALNSTSSQVASNSDTDCTATWTAS